MRPFPAHFSSFMLLDKSVLGNNFNKLVEWITEFAIYSKLKSGQHSFQTLTKGGEYNCFSLVVVLNVDPWDHLLVWAL